MTKAKLLIIGADGGTNIGGSFLRAAATLGVEAKLFDMRGGDLPSLPLRALRKLGWSRRPTHLAPVSAAIGATAAAFRPTHLLAIGYAPIVPDDLAAIGKLGAHRSIYLSDDPWNVQGGGAGWLIPFFHAYDLALTPRQSNADKLTSAGRVPKVVVLPFGYDAGIFYVDPQSPAGTGPDVVFVGGADRERAPFIEALAAAGLEVVVYGDYWRRFLRAGVATLKGQSDAATIRAATRAARLNLCLVRRANHDGHVMRSYEILAAGGVPLAERTPDHEELYGREGDVAAFFNDPDEAARKAKEFLIDAPRRAAMARAASELVRDGKHSYADRLRAIFAASGV